MRCVKCNVKMISWHSKEQNNVRYRTYRCPVCDAKIGSEERIVSFASARYMANKITAERKARTNG